VLKDTSNTHRNPKSTQMRKATIIIDNTPNYQAPVLTKLNNPYKTKASYADVVQINEPVTTTPSPPPTDTM
jgi:hypothetical protein